LGIITEVAIHIFFITEFISVKTGTIDKAIELAKANPIFKISGCIEVREMQQI